MSKKLYGLISGLLGAAATAASVCLAYFQPANYGAIIAAVNYLRIMLMYHDTGVAIVVSLTLLCVVVTAKFLGATLPIFATKLKLDPALMASPMITTIVDAVALLVYFNVAVRILDL